MVVYTPPYCPRANAIEPMFKGMNDFIRANRSQIRRPASSVAWKPQGAPAPCSTSCGRRRTSRSGWTAVACTNLAVLTLSHLELGAISAIAA